MALDTVQKRWAMIPGGLAWPEGAAGDGAPVTLDAGSLSAIAALIQQRKQPLAVPDPPPLPPWAVPSERRNV